MMHLGKQISQLRKQKNVTQEELAAELGVTATAVSKWENNYTLPDLLMLCALADYFQVTTDELLGRRENVKYAVIAAATPELGQRIADLAKHHNVIATDIYTDYPQALNAATDNSKISFLLVSMNDPMAEKQHHSAPDRLHILESQSSDEKQVLKGFEMFLSHLA